MASEPTLDSGGLDPERLADAVLAGDRASIARAITLVESTHADHFEPAGRLLDRLLPHTGGATRIGISGVPGAGKSTFVDALGMRLLNDGRRVAVLAVDPSSRVSGGSILGDRTRMARLSREANAFIRPSPAGETLGGVAARTRESMLVCEAAGFDVVLVETVGVGQSETMVSEMVDRTLVLLIAGAGDELQGIKRGILEAVDVLAINKADGDNAGPARLASASYKSALRLLRGRDVPVHVCSALEDEGVSEVWETLQALWTRDEADGSLAARRSRQTVAWMWRLVDERLRSQVRRADRAELVRDVVRRVADGTTSASAGATEVLRSFQDAD